MFFDLEDTYFHELSHASKNIQHSSRTNVEADHLFHGPIDAGAGNLGSGPYAK